MSNYEKILNGELSSGDAANLIEALEAKLKNYEGGEYEAQVKALEAEVKKWKGREAGMAQNHLDELGLRLGLEESLKSCQEALAIAEGAVLGQRCKIAELEEALAKSEADNKKLWEESK